ncbi:MAG TPA: P-loop NTPase fold protein, partial [Anaerolineales bacterium]|nr:P-loop NTPase fold protein [Anaerolineales bacterium]
MNEGPLQRSGINIFEPIKELKFDHLGRSQFASRILARVSEPDCPATLGLYGGWGVGKTSILHLMETLNDDKNKRGDVTPIIEYIDVWPYEISGDLAIPLLIHTRKLIGKALPENYKTSWKRILGVLAQAGTDLLLRKYLNLELSDVQNYKDNLQDVAPTHKQLRDLETLIDDIGDARNLFSDLVQFACAANQNRRIVFLIDNLDRCSPENVVRLLESTKNFLDAPNCTWVFAMDSGVIASYIDRKYNDTKMDGNNYLDKIIPEQYHVPPVSFADLRKLV